MGILANWRIEPIHFCTVSCVKLVTSRLRGSILTIYTAGCTAFSFLTASLTLQYKTRLYINRLTHTVHLV